MGASVTPVIHIYWIMAEKLAGGRGVYSGGRKKSVFLSELNIVSVAPELKTKFVLCIFPIKTGLCLTLRYRFYLACLFSPRLGQKRETTRKKEIIKEDLYVPSKSVFSLEHHLSPLRTRV